MTGKRIGYIRVSTIDQNPERQLEGLDLDKRFIDYVSGKTVLRPQLIAMLDYIREDDTLYVHSMDRLSRSVKDLRNIIDNLTDKKIAIHFVKENLTFTGIQSPMNNLLLMLMGAIAEFEHALIKERILEGTRIAKLAGKYKGRKTLLTPDMIVAVTQQMQTRKSKSQIAKELGISRFSLYKYLAKINQPTNL